MISFCFRKQKRAQTSVEYTIAIAGLFILLLIVLGTLYPYPSLIQSSRDTELKRYFSLAEIGILLVTAFENESHFLLKNNGREDIVITTLVINTESHTALNLTTQPLLPGNQGLYSIEKKLPFYFTIHIIYTIPSLDLERIVTYNNREFSLS